MLWRGSLRDSVPAKSGTKLPRNFPLLDLQQLLHLAVVLLSVVLGDVLVVDGVGDHTEVNYVRTEVAFLDTCTRQEGDSLLLLQVEAYIVGGVPLRY